MSDVDMIRRGDALKLINDTVTNRGYLILGRRIETAIRWQRDMRLPGR